MPRVIWKGAISFGLVHVPVALYPTSTQTIEIESCVRASEISFTRLETPYYLAPIGKGEKVYALLRESMSAAGVIGIARVVMHTKEHLAARIESVTPLEDAPVAGDASNVVDLTELLANSLAKRKPASSGTRSDIAAASAKKTSAKPAARKRA